MSAAERSPENTDQYIPGLEQFGQQPASFNEVNHKVVSFSPEPHVQSRDDDEYISPTDKWLAERGGNPTGDEEERPRRAYARRNSGSSGKRYEERDGRSVTRDLDLRLGGASDAVPPTIGMLAAHAAIRQDSLVAKAEGDPVYLLAVQRAREERKNRKK